MVFENWQTNIARTLYRGKLQPNFQIGVFRLRQRKTHLVNMPPSMTLNDYVAKYGDPLYIGWLIGLFHNCDHKTRCGNQYRGKRNPNKSIKLSACDLKLV